MDASQIVLTAEGRQKLVEELAWREGDYAKEIVEDIKEARAFGDLSENSEYDAAKDKQAQNAARIAEIQAILANAQVAATTGDLTVSIGSTVSLRYSMTGRLLRRIRMDLLPNPIIQICLMSRKKTMIQQIPLQMMMYLKLMLTLSSQTLLI